ncbi:hypothetical protein PHYBLDRAFT_166784 [Phycomyces blakesleeanus NRRL 1555(-)]|uniref:Uncharacterized protein n=1 Tax=Phycomyces blakesleeanus (strain ATCC 8743b / DSM 1359 / FGSC 10004 / NBRC 33097 / NRRL 1555) TaxID=763407 RepID=A0A162PSE8_PHYB8|nr:hypothetical protein PHYBLDRAFT_166784 [Phycomyces blakesleeanus NRRL 1555(-)]OAD75547.1 hypothetical protein PHYBLDRAFT_166784 [Phycomyces blakesleeanus NRRL 1555(-)]|eukprot:XP_018293587.1 hypothetical protein PHYBLDRAFT_166784 [Phycomyces blakesleeanus NRRL 1555(-)]
MYKKDKIRIFYWLRNHPTCRAPKKNGHITDKREEVLVREIDIRDPLHKNYGEAKTIWKDNLKAVNNVDCSAGDVVLVSIKKKYKTLIKKFKERQTCVPESSRLQMALSEKDRLMMELINLVSVNKTKTAKVYAEKEHIIQERSTSAIHSVVKGGLHAAKKLRVENGEGPSTQVPVSPVVPSTSAAYLFLSLKEQVVDAVSTKVDKNILLFIQSVEGAVKDIRDDENVLEIDSKLDKVLEELSSMKTEIREGSLRVEKTIEKLIAFIAAFVSSTTQPPPQ